MMNRPIVRILISQWRLIGLLARYIYLHVLYIMLLMLRFLFKAAGAALVESVKIGYCITSLSKEYRVIFAACIALLMYLLALNLLIQM